MNWLPQQVRPLLLAFALVITAFFAGRYLFTPETFGQYGHYRAAAVDEIQAQSVAYAGYQACMDCHDDVFTERSKSHHRSIACETCHGPAAAHIEAPDEHLPEVPTERDFCPLCHGYNISRPTGFPQVIAERHNPGQPCQDCHDPHNPVLPNAPAECSACHRNIYNVKLSSHHAALACTECHIVPTEHFTSPNAIPAEKPRDRSVCGKCHDRELEGSREIPKIDLQSHGGRYLCWECHYPHYPEAYQ